MGKLLLPDEGLTTWTDQALQQTLIVGTIKSALAADKNTTLADVLAIESDYPGYAEGNYVAGNWAPSILVGDVAKTIGNHVIFNFAGGPLDGQDIYGYWVSNVAKTRLLLVQVAAPDPPTPIDLAHPTFTVIPGFGLFSQYTS